MDEQPHGCDIIGALHLRPDITDRLEELAASDGMDLAYVVALAISDFIARHPNRRRLGPPADRLRRISVVNRIRMPDAAEIARQLYPDSIQRRAEMRELLSDDS